MSQLKKTLKCSLFLVVMAVATPAFGLGPSHHLKDAPFRMATAAAHFAFQKGRLSDANAYLRIGLAIIATPKQSYFEDEIGVFNVILILGQARTSSIRDTATDILRMVFLSNTNKQILRKFAEERWDLRPWIQALDLTLDGDSTDLYASGRVAINSLALSQVDLDSGEENQWQYRQGLKQVLKRIKRRDLIKILPREIPFCVTVLATRLRIFKAQPAFRPPLID